MVSFFSGMLVWEVVGGLYSMADSPGFKSAGWILLATAGICLLSFVDDRKGLPVAVRFIGHLVAAGALVWGGGLVLPSIQVPILGVVDLGWTAAPVTIVFLVWMANLYNFMDGMDGLAGGMTVLGFGLLAVLAWQAEHQFLLASAVLQSVAAAGFLFHNFPPAKLFMGDVGSVATGFLCGALMLLGCRDGVFDLWVPLMVFSPFILDATATLVRRAWNQRRLWEAHREHFYQRLVLSGWSHRRTVVSEYGLIVVSGGLALAYHYGTEAFRPTVILVWILLHVVAASAVFWIERRALRVGV